MRDIVSYAKSLYIEIIPEIDSPGHIQAEMFHFVKLDCHHLPFAQFPGHLSCLP